MFNLTYEFKLKPTKNQIETFSEWLETHRRVYNYALAERKDWYKSRSCQIKACSNRSCYIIPASAPRPTFASQCKSLTAARKSNEYLGKVNAQSLQQTLRRLEKAFVSMWEQNHGFPRFKKVGRMRSFSFPQLGKNPLQNGYIKLPVITQVASYAIDSAKRWYLRSAFIIKSSPRTKNGEENAKRNNYCLCYHR
ncbi:MAG: transposase [Rivularia sp. (in: cyanobacteria)]